MRGAGRTMTTADEGAGLRERKKRMTRQALRTAAVRLFAERGPASVTVDEICAEAGVSPRTFFNYFDSKEETLLPFTRDTYEEVAGRVRARPPEEEPLGAVRAVVEQSIARAVAGDTWRQEAALLRANPQVLQRGMVAARTLNLALRDGLGERAGRGADDPYVRLVAAVSVTAVHVAVNVWQGAAEERDMSEVLAEAFDGIERGLAPPPE